MTDVEVSIRLLTAKEVADLFRLAPSTIFDAAARGIIPCVRLWRGKRKSVVRFRRVDIEALIGPAGEAGSLRDTETI